MTALPAQIDRKGILFAIGAYGSWGILPLYIHLLQGVPALQVLAHRVLWSLLFLGGLILLLRRAKSIAAAIRGRTLLLLLASAALIAINWIVYIWAVLNSHILEASLGYFINPLVNVALGVMVLGERLRRWQGVAIGVAAAGVLVLAASGGGALWISLTLAASFGAYGLVRKVAAIDALGGLVFETLLLAPLCLGWLIHADSLGEGAFGTSAGMTALLIIAGPVTALPLLWFSAGARRLPLSTMGLLQFMSPTIQFGLALLFGEPLRPVHFITFPLIWAGCALFAWDAVRASRAPVPPEAGEQAGTA
ncbi:EamA family transporter RarD [Sphingomonas soli]|uniref:EamA family transporter RarD n=1 Tax=Sphingomonas soli TaxID=266127 RepID=UPI000837550A|nr:EamA family transporter RarD [Sphingomonas soli]